MSIIKITPDSPWLVGERYQFDFEISTVLSETAVSKLLQQLGDDPRITAISLWHTKRAIRFWPDTHYLHVLTEAQNAASPVAIIIGVIAAAIALFGVAAVLKGVYRITEPVTEPISIGKLKVQPLPVLIMALALGIGATAITKLRG